MKKIMISACWLLAILFAGMTLAATLLFRGENPVLVRAPEEAVHAVEELMDAVCSGNFEAAETMIYGQPDLGADRMPADQTGIMIWEAYVNSLDYELVGDLYTTDAGIAQDVKIISMELSTVTDRLRNRTQQLLSDAVAAAEDVSELYDEENEYREDLVMDTLHRAVTQALEEDVRYTYQVIRLQLVCIDGQWKTIADRSFLNAISGGISG